MRFIWEYQGLARDYIRAMKYQPSIRLLRIASNILGQAAPLLFANTSWDIIIPVPSSPIQLRKRLLNPCSELARDISRLQKIPLAHPLLHSSARAPQATLSHEKRLKSLRNLFRLKEKKLVENKRILIIEDVITTGATINAATFQLYAGGAASVDVLALARTRVWRRFRNRLHELFT
jgi:predicted amidophosphoribosyltransferase